MIPVLKTLPIRLDNKKRNRGLAIEYGPVKGTSNGPRSVTYELYRPDFVPDYAI